ncbi:MAG: hypothetical protein ACR2MT_13710, partial [Aurantibacter sp.]
GNPDFLLEHYRFRLDLETSRFMDLAKSAKRIVYIVLILITGLLSFVKLGKVGLGKIVTLRLIALTFVIGLALEVLLSGSGAHPIMVTFFPAVVFLTGYVESIKKPNIKEIVLMASILVPFIVLATNLLIDK